MGGGDDGDEEEFVLSPLLHFFRRESIPCSLVSSSLVISITFTLFRFPGKMQTTFPSCLHPLVFSSNRFASLLDVSVIFLLLLHLLIPISSFVCFPPSSLSFLDPLPSLSSHFFTLLTLLLSFPVSFVIT